MLWYRSRSGRVVGTYYEASSLNVSTRTNISYFVVVSGVNGRLLQVCMVVFTRPHMNYRSVHIFNHCGLIACHYDCSRIASGVASHTDSWLNQANPVNIFFFKSYHTSLSFTGYWIIVLVSWIVRFLTHTHRQDNGLRMKKKISANMLAIKQFKTKVQYLHFFFSVVTFFMVE